MISGKARRTCVTISGGVRIAASINVRTIPYLLFFLINEGVSMPILVKKYDNIGNSKTIPKTSTSKVTNFKYSLIVMLGTRVSVCQPSRNFKPIGMMTK